MEHKTRRRHSIEFPREFMIRNKEKVCRERKDDDEEDAEEEEEEDDGEDRCGGGRG